MRSPLLPDGNRAGGAHGAGRTPRIAPLAVAAALAALTFATPQVQPATTAGTTAGGTMGSTPAGTSEPVELERTAALSRDSSRDALEDAAGGQVRVRGGQAREENAELARLAADAEKAVAEILENAWQLPLGTGTYRLTARFGQCSGLWAHCHTGLDFAAPTGTPVRAVANGAVVDTGWAGAYGNRTVLRLEDGTEVWYCHLSGFAVRAGDQVVGGQVVGFVGSTGNSTGPHLHLEVRPGGGDPVDPDRALAVHGIAP